MNHLRYRYPGVKPFENTDRDLFFGRDKDIDDLTDLILLEKLVVLFGKSGYGKSSLLNAGILPELTGIMPILIRIGNYSPGASFTPLDLTRRGIQETVEISQESTPLFAKLTLSPSLWLELKRRQTDTVNRFIFIFDQFEEFFTHPFSTQASFKEQLAEMLYASVPQSIRNQSEELTDDELTFIATPFDVRVVLSIRSDRLSLLDSMKDKLPAILNKRYELKGLSRTQARDAIVKPAAARGEFITPPFTFTQEALSAMLDELTVSNLKEQRHTIESFQLQIICQSIETVVEQQLIHEITRNDLPDLSDIYGNYYHRQIDRLASPFQLPARLIIEDELIDDREARRISVDSRTLSKKPNVTPELLDALENTFLIRRENNTVGGLSYELSHDTLIEPVLLSKQTRMARQEREELERQRHEAEQKAREETNRSNVLQLALTSADRQTKLARRWLLLAGTAFFVALLTAMWALSNQKVAERSKAVAEAAEKKAFEERKVAVSNLLQFQKTVVDNQLQDAISFQRSGNTALANTALDSAEAVINQYFKGTNEHKPLLNQILKIRKGNNKPSPGN